MAFGTGRFRSLTENVDTTSPGGRLIIHLIRRGTSSSETRSGTRRCRAGSGQGPRPAGYRPWLLIEDQVPPRGGLTRRRT